MKREKEQTKEEVIRICSHPDRRNYVCLLMRPGFYGWMVQLEYTVFKPDTDDNDDFHMMLCKWPESEPIAPLTIGVISIHKRGQEFADSTLWYHGLKKTNPDTVLTTFTPTGGTEKFFLSGPNVFNLENHSEGTKHVVYYNDPDKMELARKHEHEYCERFFEEHRKWIESPEGKAIADAYWAKHPEGRVW